MSVHGLLVTGPKDSLRRFQLAVCFYLNPIDQRGETVRYTCMAEHLALALAHAKDTDVTVQEIVTSGVKNARHFKLSHGASATVSDCIEEYPVLHLSSTGKKWERAEAAR